MQNSCNSISHLYIKAEFRLIRLDWTHANFLANVIGTPFWITYFGNMIPYHEVLCAFYLEHSNFHLLPKVGISLLWHSDITYCHTSHFVSSLFWPFQNVSWFFHNTRLYYAFLETTSCDICRCTTSVSRMVLVSLHKHDQFERQFFRNLKYSVQLSNCQYIQNLGTFV